MLKRHKIELQIGQLCLPLTNSVSLTVFEIPILNHEFVTPCIYYARWWKDNFKGHKMVYWTTL